MVGIATDGTMVVLKFKLQSGATEVVVLASTHAVMFSEALDKWTAMHPDLDCGNLANAKEIQRLPNPILDNTPGLLLPDDWDGRATTATPFLHLFSNGAVLVAAFNSGKEAGYSLDPGAIWTLRSVLNPDRSRLIDLRKRGIETKN
jgi:hypothetical protein